MATLLTDFLGKGTAAAMPASPPAAITGSAFYYQTDTQVLKVWNGLAWVNASQGAAPTVVQSQFSAGSVQSVTFGAAPTNGNLLVAMVFSPTPPTAGAGWKLLSILNGVPPDDMQILYKIAGAGESTTQTPLNSAITGCLGVWEVTASNPGINNNGNSGSSSAFGLALVGPAGGGLVLGAAENTTDTTLPTSITNGTNDGNASSGTRSIQGFHAGQGAGSTTYTANYAAAKAVEMNLIYIR